MKPRVAILGASGIGRFHANWWRLEGAEVCAFLGTSPESVEQTAARLSELFPFDGQGYTDFDALLNEARPDFVDVCTPPPKHAGHVRRALEAGCHVLCEKPFVYDPALPHDTLRGEARFLADLARERGLHLGVCTQYTTGAQIFEAHWKQYRPGERLTTFEGWLEAPAKGRPPDPFRTWADLSPHPLSVLVHFAPGAALDDTRLRTTFDGHLAVAEFPVVASSGHEIACRIQTRNRTEEPAHVRAVALNGYRFDVDGRRDDDGQFAARIQTADGAVDSPDMMRLLIRAMLAGTPAAAGADALKTLDWMLRIEAHARQTAVS